MPAPKARAAMFGSADEIEAQFYEALQRGDVERVMSLWSDDDEVACVHPNGPRLVGPAAVRASYEAILGNGALPVRLHRVRRVENAGCAVHHVLERIDVPAENGVHTAWVVATNVYLKTPQGWRLVLHHASAGSDGEAQEISADAPTTLH